MDEEEVIETNLEHYLAGIVAGLLHDFCDERADVHLLPPIVLEDGTYDSACLVELGPHTYEVRVTKKSKDRIIDER